MILFVNTSQRTGKPAAEVSMTYRVLPIRGSARAQRHRHALALAIRSSSFPSLPFLPITFLSVPFLPFPALSSPTATLAQEFAHHAMYYEALQLYTCAPTIRTRTGTIRARAATAHKRGAGYSPLYRYQNRYHSYYRTATPRTTAATTRTRAATPVLPPLLTRTSAAMLPRKPQPGSATRTHAPCAPRPGSATETHGALPSCAMRIALRCAPHSPKQTARRPPPARITRLHYSNCRRYQNCPRPAKTCTTMPQKATTRRTRATTTRTRSASARTVTYPSQLLIPIPYCYRSLTATYIP